MSMMKIMIASLLMTQFTPLIAAGVPFDAALKTHHNFHASDENLQCLHDAAERKLLENLVQFIPSMKVLVEGGGYLNAWIETQPMGGEISKGVLSRAAFVIENQR
jgi:hypothetical protein